MKKIITLIITIALAAGLTLNAGAAAVTTAAATAKSTVKEPPKTTAKKTSKNNKAVTAYRNEYRKLIPDIMKAYSSYYTAVSIDSKGDSTIIFSYYYIKEYDSGELVQARDLFNNSLATLQAAVNTDFAVMKAAPYKIKNPKIIYRYYNGGDKALIWEHTFTAS